MSTRVSKRTVPSDVTFTPSLSRAVLRDRVDWVAIAATCQIPGQGEEFSAAYRGASLEHPDEVRFLTNVTSNMQAQDREAEAIGILRSALRRDQRVPEAWHNLGSLARNLGRYELAEAAYEQAARRWDRPMSAIGLSEVRLVMGDVGGAITSADIALSGLNERDPGWVDACLARAFAALLDGDLERGWAWLDARLLRPEYAPLIPSGIAPWTPDTPSGAHVLVWREQGLGDETRYLSCIPDLLRRGYRCTVRCSPRLARIISRSFPVEVIGPDEPVPEDVDTHISTGSLPRYLRTTPDAFPTTPAYFAADEARVAELRAHVEPLGHRPVIGLSWRSAYLTTKRSTNYPYLAELRALADTGATFISLQYASNQHELDAIAEYAGLEVTTVGDLDLTNDIDGVAALCCTLDGVVSVGNTVAEIAGAVGARVYQLSNANAPIQLGRRRSPWHPNTELFSRNYDEAWASPIAAIADRLRHDLA